MYDSAAAAPSMVIWLGNDTTASVLSSRAVVDAAESASNAPTLGSSSISCVRASAEGDTSSRRRTFGVVFAFVSRLASTSVDVAVTGLSNPSVEFTAFTCAARSLVVVSTTTFTST